MSSILYGPLFGPYTAWVAATKLSEFPEAVYFKNTNNLYKINEYELLCVVGRSYR